MRLLVAALAALLLVVPAAEAQSTISMPGVGAALTASSGASGGGVAVTGGGYYNGPSFYNITRAPNFPAAAIGSILDGDPCESGGTGRVSCLAPPSSVTFSGGTGPDIVYIGSPASGGVNVTSINTGGGNDKVWIGGNGGRGPVDGGDGIDQLGTYFTYGASGGGWTIDLAAGTVTSDGAPGVSYSAKNFENVELATDLGAAGGTYTVYGTDGPNTVYGGRGGVQTIFGRDGNDYLVAGYDDKAVIDGGPGNDTLTGLSKDDLLTGGPGADKFSCGAGVDLVTDFNSAEGDTITADCEQVLPAAFDITRVGRGDYKFQSRIVAEPAVQPLVVSWDFGNGKTAGDLTVTGTVYDKPGTYSVVHRGKDLRDTNYRTTKTLVVPAPELDVSIALDEAALSGGRLPLNAWVNATVRVASTGDEGVGDLSALTFTGGQILKATGTAAVEIEQPANPAAFALAPGKDKQFSVRVRATTRGDLAFTSALTGKDAAGANVSDTYTEPIRAGLDLEITVTSTPAELDLAVDGTANPPRPIKKPVKLTVRVRNLSGQPAESLELDLLPAIRAAGDFNPAADFPLQLKQADGPPAVPLTNATAREIPVRNLAAGEATDVVFSADAANKGIVDVRAVARGVAAQSGSLPRREITGNGTTPVRISQPKLIALTATGPANVAIKAGQRWSYSGHVENLSPDRDVTVFVFTKRKENVVDGQMSSILEPGQCTCGVYKRLEPGERIDVQASMGSNADGGTRGIVEIAVIGTVHEPEGDVKLKDTEVVVAPGADRRTASIDLTAPVNDPFSLSEAGWLMTDSAARAFGARVTGAYESAAAALAAAQTFVETPKSLYLQQVIAWIHEEVPEAVARTRSEIAYTLQEMAGLSAAEALAVSDQALTTGMIKTSEAWDNATWQDMSRTTGTLLGTLAPDLALEAAMPALAACKLLKYGGKSAMLRKAAKLGETRAGRLLAKGLEGLVPGDEISALLARKLWGIDGIIDTQLIAYAKAKKVVIAVRERSPGSIRRLAEGMLPKWEKVKAKNVSSIDVDFLGFHPNHLDTAMLKQMPDWSVIEAKLAGKSPDVRRMVEERWKQRKKEWEGKDLQAMLGYGQSGKIPKPSTKYGVNPTENGLPAADGVWTDAEFELTVVGKGDLDMTTDGLPAFQPRVKENGRYRPMTGDMDPIAVLDENGQILDLDRRLEVYKDLAKMGFQHPESLTWDNAAERAKYLFDFDLANGKGRALLAYGPDGTRRAAYFDSRKSRLADGLMVLVGTDMVMEATKVVKGEVPVIEAPETVVERPYITPGGDAGANLSRSPDARLIRRNLDGSFEEWTEAGGWQPYTLPGGQTLTTLPQTSVRTAVAAGETRIDINDASALILLPGAQSWFEPGDVVVLDPGGPNEEFVRVAALGSIIAAEPLKKAHRVGEMVAVVPGTAVLTPTSTPPAVATPTPPVATPVPPAKPRVLSAKLAKKTFKRKAGTKLSLVLSERATVTVTLTRAVTGRTVGKRCKAGAKRGRKCTLEAPAGKVTIKPKSAKVTVAFGKGLRAGRYTAKLSAGGGAATTLRFTVR